MYTRISIASTESCLILRRFKKRRDKKKNIQKTSDVAYKTFDFRKSLAMKNVCMCEINRSSIRWSIDVNFGLRNQPFTNITRPDGALRWLQLSKDRAGQCDYISAWLSLLIKSDICSQWRERKGKRSESQTLESNQFHRLLGPIASPLHSKEMLRRRCIYLSLSKSHSLN